MAVIYEQMGNGLVKAYSDMGMMIKGGSPYGKYEEAIDIADLNRKYEETDTPISRSEETIKDDEAIN